jgi:dTDP-4-amino-4,6-dideoxy-D-galactose acyltransferase
MQENLCDYLDWDSEFFGQRIARVAPTRLNAEMMRDVLRWCEENSIDCLYFLADAADKQSAVLAADNGFHFMDVRVTYERPLVGEKGWREKAAEVRLSVPEDVPILSSIARIGHRDSRFYFDPGFSESACDALYGTWIEKSCRGYADAVLVAEFEGRPAGYISLHLKDGNKGQIGLVGVSADARGHGLGKKLINESLRWFVERGVANVTVVTQGRNLAAQRIYQKSGFLLTSVEVWYHRWFKKEAA